ncbi:Putative AC9 transposase [Linum perenne]
MTIRFLLPTTITQIISSSVCNHCFVSHAGTLKKEILGMYEIERVKIKKKIDANIGRIAITIDMWSATTLQKGYMAVTAHYIDNNWRLQNHMLQFVYVPAPHTADNLASRLFSLLDGMECGCQTFIYHPR